LQGPKAIEETMEAGMRKAAPGSTSASDGLRHTLSNVVIRLDGNTATSPARWTVMTPGPAGRPMLGGTGRYVDSLTKQGGAWKFKRRVITTDIPVQDLVIGK
jgi:hypothetical protein